MDRLSLALLEVTNGKLPPATLPFANGLNLVSGAENRGKTYAFGCLDFLMGASDPPDPNPHSAGYRTATLYYTVNTAQRGAIRRHLDTGDAEYLPLHPASEDVPTNWLDLKKSHTAKSLNLSSYWVTAFGFQPSLLRGNMSGDVKALTARYLAHLVLVDELRIVEKRSPARSSQAVAWPADADCLALVLGARKNEPKPRAASVAPVTPQMPEVVREFIKREIERLDSQIQELSGAADQDADEAAEMTRRAADFTAAANAAAKELQRILGEMEAAQQNLTSARTKMKASREIAARLELLQEYYSSDLRRLEAITETAFLLEQLNSVPCPTCNHPFEPDPPTPDDEISKEYLGQIQKAAKAETAKILSLRRDLSETLARASEDSQESLGSERSWSETLDRLRDAERSQNKRVEEVHAQLNETFEAMGQLAQRHALKQRRADLAAQLAEALTGPEPPAPAAPVEERTEFDSKAIDDFCEIIKKLLIAWNWKYTAGPLTVTFDQATTDIVISGAPRSSFGKAVRALASSAFIIAIMDYCFARDLPHPGFVVLDSPLTTKKDSGKIAQDDTPVTDDIVAAFFTHLAENYSDKQILIFDNKEPPASLKGRINHIRFEDDATATRKGFFP